MAPAVCILNPSNGTHNCRPGWRTWLGPTPSVSVLLYACACPILRAAPRRRTLPLNLKAKCITTLRCSGHPDAMEYPPSGAATLGHCFKGSMGSGLAKPGLETRVAALVTVSNGTYGEKYMPWHGVYGNNNNNNNSNCLSHTTM